MKIFKNSEDKKAFTLAEVLITLLIIGVIAAMTLPTIYHNIQRKVLYTQFIKAVSVLNQAAKMYQNDYGCENLLYCWANGDKDFTVNFSKAFTGATVINDDNADEICKSYTKTEVNNGYGNNNADYISTGSDAIYYTCKNNLGNNKDSCYKISSILTKDGMLFSFCLDDGTGSGQIVDVNGPDKGPNAYGRDIFVFYWGDEPDKDYPSGRGIFWGGDEQGDRTDVNWNTPCTPDDGTGCAAKLLREHAMNY